MKKNICVVTGTRADYHLLSPLLKRIQEDEELNLQLVVTGSHLTEKYGNTYLDIERDGFAINCKIPILKETDRITDINNAMANEIVGFDAYVSHSTTDMIVLLGDRYELLAAACVAMNYRIPIAHIHGGETTEGAIDECIRHAITKMSYLHFTSCEVYRQRVIQMGESPERVFNVGALGVENIKYTRRMSKKELEESLSFRLTDKFFLITFHPVTLEENTAMAQMEELLKALDGFEDYKLLFTKSNADSGGMGINAIIDEYVDRDSERCCAFFSLGMVRYISAMSYAAAVIGNSSSGILETPSIPVPCVNIGDRQRGRVQANNIVNCEVDKREIVESITKVISDAFKAEMVKTVSPYGDGNTSQLIIKYMKGELNRGINLKKHFYEM